MTHAQIRRKYTTVLRVGRGRFNTYLCVGVQSFCVVEGTDRVRAKWFADMLARAVANLIKENQP